VRIGVWVGSDWGYFRRGEGVRVGSGGGRRGGCRVFVGLLVSGVFSTGRKHY
jgi:hypothetical protein